MSFSPTKLKYFCLLTDSPTLRIITNPKVVHTGYTGNITVTCNLKSKDPYNPVSRGYLVVKRGSTNETIASNLLSGIVNPFNVSVVVPNAIFRNESFLVAECTGRMDTDSCTHGTKRLGLEGEQTYIYDLFSLICAQELNDEATVFL